MQGQGETKNVKMEKINAVSGTGIRVCEMKKIKI